MPITNAQILNIKNHLGFYGYGQENQTVESQLANINGNALYEADLLAKLTDCDTRKLAWDTAQSNSDDLMSGEGATFDYREHIRLKQDWYKQALMKLADALSLPYEWCPALNGDKGTSSGSQVATGWRYC